MAELGIFGSLDGVTLESARVTAWPEVTDPSGLQQAEQDALNIGHSVQEVSDAKKAGEEYVQTVRNNRRNTN
jgi:hypothetical protein